jgi:hypothetical protein
MRTALLILTVLGLAACSENPDYAQQGYNPHAVPPRVAPGPTLATVPAPPGDLPSGAAHKVCVTAVSLC